MIVGGGGRPARNLTRHAVHRPRPPHVAVMSTPPACLAMFALSALVTACAPAKPVTTLAADSTGRIHFQSLSLTAEQFTSGVQNASPVTISGELILPARATPIPAIILLHGSGGVTETETGWSRELASFGVATFLLDS